MKTPIESNITEGQIFPDGDSTWCKLYCKGMYVGFRDRWGDHINIKFVEDVPSENEIRSFWDGSIIGTYTDQFREEQTFSFGHYESECFRIDEECNPIAQAYRNAPMDKQESIYLLAKNQNYELLTQLFKNAKIEF